MFHRDQERLIVPEQRHRTHPARVFSQGSQQGLRALCRVPTVTRQQNSTKARHMENRETETAP